MLWGKGSKEEGKGVLRASETLQKPGPAPTSVRREKALLVPWSNSELLLLVVLAVRAIPSRFVPPTRRDRLRQLFTAMMGWRRGRAERENSASLVAEIVKNLPTVQETSVQSLGGEDPLEEGMAAHSSILAWSIPMDREAWRATVQGVAKSRTRLSTAQHPSWSARKRQRGCWCP